MRQDRIINVFFHDRLVGTLAMTNERKAAFEYADEWLENGFSISPFSLPLEKYMSRLKIILMAYGEYLQTVCLMHGDSCCLTGC